MTRMVIRAVEGGFIVQTPHPNAGVSAFGGGNPPMMERVVSNKEDLLRLVGETFGQSCGPEPRIGERQHEQRYGAKDP